MTQEQQDDEQANQEDEAARGALGPPKSVEDVCSSCGGVVVTVVFGGRDRPEIGFRLGWKGRRHIRLYDEERRKPAPRSLRRDVCSAEQGTVFGRPPITIICGGCGTSLIRFGGEAYD